MKTAVVTGAGGGIGSAAAKALIAAGYEVWGLDLKASDNLPELRFLEADLRDRDSIESAFETIRVQSASIDCIVHAAGLYDLDSLAEIDEARLLRIFDVNLFAVCRVNQVFLPLLKKGGRILIITSELAPLDPLPFTGIYAVTKAALDRYAYSLRMELQLLGICAQARSILLCSASRQRHSTVSVRKRGSIPSMPSVFGRSSEKSKRGRFLLKKQRRRSSKRWKRNIRALSIESTEIRFCSCSTRCPTGCSAR